VDIGLDDGLAALERGQRHGGSSRRHVAAVAVDPGLEAEFGDLGLEIGREADAREALAGRNEVVTQRLDLAGVLRSRIGSAASAAVGLERAVDDLDAVVDLATALDGGPESEAISQLGAQIALLWVHRADEGEAGGVGDADAVALDGVDAVRGRVEDHVDEVVVEQVDLVDVEDAAVRAGQQARIEVGLAGQRVFDGEGADDAVSSRTERKRDERNRSRLDREVVGVAFAALIALQIGVVGRTAVRTVGDGPLLGEEIHECPNSGRLRGSLRRRSGPRRGRRWPRRSAARASVRPVRRSPERGVTTAFAPGVCNHTCANTIRV